MEKAPTLSSEYWCDYQMKQCSSLAKHFPGNRGPRTRIFPFQDSICDKVKYPTESSRILIHAAVIHGLEGVPAETVVLPADEVAEAVAVAVAVALIDPALA